MKQTDILLSCEQAVELIVMIHTEYVIRSHHFDDCYRVNPAFSEMMADNPIVASVERLNSEMALLLFGQILYDDVNWFLFDWREGYAITVDGVEYVINNIDDYLNYVKKEYFKKD